MRKPNLRILIATIFLTLASIAAHAVPVQLNVTQNVGGGFGLQSGATGSFSQLSPTATAYVINDDFKFFVDAFSTPVLGNVTGFANSVADSATGGCEASDYTSFQTGTIALLAAGPCLFSTQVNAAFNAGAIAAIIGYPFAPFGADNFGLSDQTFIPSLIASAAIVNELTRQLRLPTPVPEPATLGLFGIAIASMVFMSRRRITAPPRTKKSDSHAK